MPVACIPANAWAQDPGGNPDLGSHALRVSGGGHILDFSGGITFGVTQEVRAMLDRNVGIRALRLESLGGRVQEARLLADLLHQRGIATYITGQCLSACAIAFVGGVERIVAPHARLGFHRDRDAFGTEEAVGETNATDRDTMIEEGVAPWFAERAYATPSSSMWFPSLDELERGHVITRVAEIGSAPGQVDKALSAPPDLGAQVDTQFQSIAVFAAIKRTAPDTYAKIRAATVDAIAHQRPAATLAAAVAPYMQSITRTSLPAASDAAIIEFAKVITLELGEIAAHSTDDCYAFGYQPQGAKTFSSLPYLSTEVLLREQAALAGLIESRASPPPHMATDKEITPSRNLLMERLIAKFGGADVEAYANARGPNPDRAKVCHMTIAFYNEAFTLPPDEQARLLRFLLVRSFAQGGGTAAAADTR